MRESRAIMADLACAGLTPDQLALVMELSAAVIMEARPSVPAADPVAEKRRAYDRQRKRGTPVVSGGTPVETAEIHGTPPDGPPLSALSPPLKPPASETKVSSAPRLKARRAPEAWSPGPRATDVAVSEGFSPGEIERELAKFRDHQFRDAHTDWDAAFRNWLRRASENRPRHERPDHQNRPTVRDERIGRALAGALEAANG